MKHVKEIDIDNCQNVLHAISNPIIIMDLEKNIKFMNESAKQLVDIPYETCLNQKCSCFHTPFCDTSNCCVERFLRGEDGMIQHGPNDTANRVSISYLYDDQHTPIGYISVSTDVKELLRTQRELVINQERFKIALRQSKSLLFRYDPYKKTVSRMDTTNKLTFHILPLFDTLSHVPQFLWEHKILAPENIPDIIKMCDQIALGCSECECSVRLKTQDQVYRWFNIQCTTIFDHDGSVIEAIGILKDITEEKELKQDYQSKKEYFDIVSSEYIHVYEVDLNTGEITSINQNCPDDLKFPDGCTYDEMLLDLNQYINPDDSSILHEKQRSQLIKRFQNGEKQYICEYRRIIDNRYQWIRSTMNFVEQHNGHVLARVSIKNINEEKCKEVEWKKKAERDLLTGLYNHMTAQANINKIIKHYPNDLHAFIIIDLDNFKETNDTYGHLFGDLVLSFVAKKMAQLFPKNSILCRLGGDEYSAFIPSVTSRESIVSICDLLCSILKKESLQGYESARISVSCGICFYDKETSSYNELYRKADIALYYGKNNGKNQCVVFDRKMEEYASLIHGKTDKKISDPFENNIRELIFKTLFTSDATDFDDTLLHVLKMIALYFHGDHCYLIVFDKQKATSNMIMEWTEDEQMAFRPHIDSYPKHLINESALLFESSQEHMIFARESKYLNIPHIRNILSSAKAKTAVMMRLHLDEAHSLIIGYCNHKEVQEFSRRQKDDFKTIFEVIGIFLQNQNQKLQQEENLKTMMALLDHIGYAIYVIDPSNHSIIYFNKEIQKSFPKLKKGALCYECFQQIKLPCTHCPIRKLKHEEGESVATDIYNPLLNCWIHTVANVIEWPDGHRYILLSCITEQALQAHKNHDD
ncbi:diguanylate cyclase domain-containing protein [[Eubacterium] hominis]|uniref:diguanylate cyclase domain-containing protein n=1 Tax=[Eubacterium] hominis TaxID=2764325 RepID=UPI003A4D8B71